MILNNRYKRTGNYAVDMVAACIISHRNKGLHPVRMYVKEPFYGMIKLFVKANSRERLDDFDVSFDDVYIEKASRFQTNTISVELNNEKGI